MSDCLPRTVPYAANGARKNGQVAQRTFNDGNGGTQEIERRYQKAISPNGPLNPDDCHTGNVSTTARVLMHREGMVVMYSICARTWIADERRLSRCCFVYVLKPCSTVDDRRKGVSAAGNVEHDVMISTQICELRGTGLNTQWMPITSMTWLSRT